MIIIILCEQCTSNERDPVLRRCTYYNIIYIILYVTVYFLYPLTAGTLFFRGRDSVGASAYFGFFFLYNVFIFTRVIYRKLSILLSLNRIFFHTSRAENDTPEIPNTAQTML